MELDQEAKKLYNLMPKGSKIAFFTTIILGLIAHMYLLNNRFPVSDDMYQIVYNMDYSTSGRWFLKYVAAITTDFSLPWLNGIVSILALGFVSGIISYMFKMKGFMTNAIFAGFMVTFPALSEMMLFINNVDADMIALLMSTIAFVLITKKWYMMIPSIILSVLSLATYQLYFIFTIAISLIYLIYLMVEKNIKLKKLFILMFKMAITFGISGLAYVYITKNLIPTRLSDYQGLNEMGTFTINSIWVGIKDAYIGFAQFISFTGSPNYYYPYLKIPFILTLAFSLILLGYCAKKKNIGIIKSIITLVLIFVLPLAINLIHVVRSESGYMAFRMLYNYVLIIFVVMLSIDLVYRNKYYLSKKQLESKKVNIADGIKMITGIVMLTLSIMIYNNITISNQLYFKVEMDFRNGSHYTNRMITKIENLKDYSKDKKVYVVGSPDSRTAFWHDYWVNELSGFSMPNTMTEIWTFDLYMKKYFGFPNPVKAYPGIKTAEQDPVPDGIKNEVKNMPIYPEKGSIKVWNDSIIVNARNIK